MVLKLSSLAQCDRRWLVGKTLCGMCLFLWRCRSTPVRGCVISCTSHRLVAPLAAKKKSERIWPLCDFLGVLPHYVVLAENEEGPVDGEAVLPDWYGVVQGHGASTLRFGLLEGWGDATCGHGSSIAVPVALGPSVPRAQQARHVVSEAGHPVGKAKSKKKERKREKPQGGRTL